MGRKRKPKPSLLRLPPNLPGGWRESSFVLDFEDRICIACHDTILVGTRITNWKKSGIAHQFAHVGACTIDARRGELYRRIENRA